MSSQTSRLILFLFCCISFVGTFLWEFILNLINSNKFQNCCNKKEKSISNNDSFQIRKFKTSIGKRRSKSLNLRTSNISAFTSKAINKNGYEYYFIKDGNSVIGYTGLKPENEKLFLSKLYILKEYRGKQVASKTFDFIERLAKGKKLKAVWLTVNRNNNHAIEVYKHKGFVVTRTQVADIGNGFVMDDYIFEKIL